VLGAPLTELCRRPFFDNHNVERLITFFQQSGLDSWVLKHSAQLGIPSHGPLGFAVLTAPDLESAIEVAADYSIIRLSYYQCEYRHNKKRLEFHFNPQPSSDLLKCWMVESGVHVIIQLIETIVAHPLGDNAVIYFTHSEPSYKKALEQFYGVKCYFNQKKNYLSIPSSWGQISSPLSDPDTYRSNLRKCQELKQDLTRDNDIVQWTRISLRNHFDQQARRTFEFTLPPNLTSLAEKQHISTRTFARRLSEKNYTYRELVEEAREKKACYLLKNTHSTISKIALQLGYSESANFIRAFKSWQQCTPSQWRRHNH